MNRSHFYASLIGCASIFAPAASIATAQTPPYSATPYALVAPQGATTGYRAYVVRHVAVDAIAPQVERLISATGEAFEVVADAKSNRLFVSGSPQVQAVAEQTIASLDRPASPPSSTPVSPTPIISTAAPPVVRTYPVAPGDLDAVAADLQRRFEPHGARVAADARTGQLLVVAAEPVQAQVAAAVGSRAPSGQALSQPAPATSSGSRSLTLEHADWTSFENRLRTIYGPRLSPTTIDPDGRRRLRLSSVDAAPLDWTFEPTARRLDLTGPAATVEAACRLAKALDRGATDAPSRVVPYARSGEESLRRALSISHRLSPKEPAAAPHLPAAAEQQRLPLVAGLFQPQAPAAAPPAPPAGANPPPAGGPPPGPDAAALAEAARAQAEATGGLVGPVQIEFLDGLDVLIVSGNDRDVERVLRIIDDIERLSVDTQPTIEVVPLAHVGGETLAAVVTQIYDSVLSARQGKVSITALVKPNALLLIGRAESVQAVRELVTKLDQPVEPSEQFAVFALKHAAASTVQQTLQTFFADRTALGGKVQVTTDVRSNSLVVRGGPRDLAEARELIARLDVATGEAENELRVFPLRNALAEELAPVLQDAVAAQAANTGGQTALPQLNLPGLAQPAATGTAAGAASAARSTALRFTTIDSQGHRQLTSGILTEVRITPDARANTLLVSAPAQAMELIAALIRQLDDHPAAQSQIKVFTIVNGDASALVEMLQALFGLRTTGQTGGLFGGTNQTPQGQNPLVQLRFSVDQRTNSIIAAGGAEDLNVVEAILLRLDDSDVRQRQSIVYRLKNAPANDVATAINNFLRSEREVQQTNTALLSPFEQIEREVVVVPEPVSNSLIVSATPRYFEEIRKLVEEIDARPPMVLIQVLIAEVSLNNTDEFGVEVGLQDSVLFDRSLLGDLLTITNSTQTPQGNTVVTTQNQNIVAATNTPGFAFNNAPIGNSGATSALAKRNVIGTQGLTSFAVGRSNADLGFGGLVLSASSESVSVLIRALQESRRLDVLSRPQVMTLDNQAAFVQVGARVPRVQGVTINQTGQTNNVVDVNVGLILGVTPRISPDGLVVMEIDAEKSALGPELEGVPISVSATGEVVRQPVINTTTAQTTVSAMNGQTVVLGGLITKSKSVVNRRVPLLSSIPILGNLFRYDNVSSERTELLIIMTPHVVRNDSDVARVRQIESARMSWVLGDVKQLHGNWGLQGRHDDWADEETMVIYPDDTPAAEQIPLGRADEAGAAGAAGPAVQGAPSGSGSERLTPPEVPNLPAEPTIAPPPAPAPPREPATLPPGDEQARFAAPPIEPAPSAPGFMPAVTAAAPLPPGVGPSAAATTSNGVEVMPAQYFAAPNGAGGAR